MNSLTIHICYLSTHTDLMNSADEFMRICRQMNMDECLDFPTLMNRRCSEPTWLIRNTLQHTAELFITLCNLVLQPEQTWLVRNTRQHIAKHCDTLGHRSPPPEQTWLIRNTLQHIAMHCNTLIYMNTFIYMSSGDKGLSVTGIEPTTSGLTVPRSYQLSIPVLENGPTLTTTAEDNRYSEYQRHDHSQLAHILYTFLCTLHFFVYFTLFCVLYTFLCKVCDLFV